MLHLYQGCNKERQQVIARDGITTASRALAAVCFAHQAVCDTLQA